MLLSIRLLIFGICVVGFLTVSSSIVIAKNFFNSDPLKLYPNGIEFRIWRDNKVIGTHIVSFTRLKNNKVLVGVKMNLVVRFLGIPVYKYNYHSRAIWLRGQLIRLFATQNDDGEVSNVEVKKRLLELIDSEDKTNPIGDIELTEKLNEEGFKVARRTISKYREELNFPTARLRRKI